MEKEGKLTWKIPWKGMLVTFFVSITSLFVVFWKISNPRDIWRELGEYPLSYFFVALFFVLVAWIIDGQRIGMLTKAVGHPIKWWQLAFLLGSANFLTLVTPFAGGGGVLIVYALYRRGLKTSVGSAIVFAGGLAGQSMLALLCLITTTTLKNVPADLVMYFNVIKIAALAYLVVLAILLMGIARSERIFNWLMQKLRLGERSATWIAEFHSTIKLFLGEARGHYLACLATAFCYYVVYYTGSFTLLSGFGVFRPWLRFAVAVLFGLAPVVSPIPGGAGLSEGISWVVLDGVLDPDALGSFIVLWRTVVFYIPILLGCAIFIYLVMQWASKVILPEEQDHTR